MLSEGWTDSFLKSLFARREALGKLLWLRAEKVFEISLSYEAFDR
jgi:hypothetical protein